MVPVILLIGSSTAGKTSICNSPAFNAFAKSGVDLAFQNPIMLSKSIYAILKHILRAATNCTVLKKRLFFNGKTYIPC